MEIEISRTYGLALTIHGDVVAERDLGHKGKYVRTANRGSTGISSEYFGSANGTSPADWNSNEFLIFLFAPWPTKPILFYF